MLPARPPGTVIHVCECTWGNGSRGLAEDERHSAPLVVDGVEVRAAAATNPTASRGVIKRPIALTSNARGAEDLDSKVLFGITEAIEVTNAICYTCFFTLGKC